MTFLLKRSAEATTLIDCKISGSSLSSNKGNGKNPVWTNCETNEINWLFSSFNFNFSIPSIDFTDSTEGETETESISEYSKSKKSDETRADDIRNSIKNLYN